MFRFTSVFLQRALYIISRNAFLFTNKKATELSNASLIGIIAQSLTEVILKNRRWIITFYLLNIVHEKKGK